MLVNKIYRKAYSLHFQFFPPFFTDTDVYITDGDDVDDNDSIALSSARRPRDTVIFLLSIADSCCLLVTSRSSTIDWSSVR